MRGGRTAPALPPAFKLGDEVEICSDDDGFRGAWFEARVVRPGIRNGRCTVLYDALMDEADETKPLRETISATCVRPRPPRHTGTDHLALHHAVDVSHNDAWWVGVVTAVRKGRYVVWFAGSGEENEYGAEEIRPHMDWVAGEWIVPEPKRVLDMEFTSGTMVEVSSDDVGFRGAWYIANITESIGKKFVVEYQHLKTDDETEPLKETVDPLYIRPTPPDTPVEVFKLFEEVDAFYNGGWWVGVISKVLDAQSYKVYFKPWKQEMEFGHKKLRLHHDWIGGRWLRASQALELC